MNIIYSLKKNIWAVILLSIALAFWWPSFGLFLQPSTIYLLMLLMLFSVLDMSYRQVFKELKHDFSKIILSLLIVHLAGPIIILFFKPWLDASLFLGLILATSINAGISIVFLAKLYGGSSSQSLVVAALSQILSPIIVPLVVFMFARASLQIDPLSIALTIAKLVLVPIALSMLVRRSSFYTGLVKISSGVNIVLLFLLITAIIAPLRMLILNNLQQAIWLSLIVALVLLIDFALGFLLGKNRGERVTFGISASYKNFVLANVLAMTLFGPLVALPAAIYAVLSNLFLIPLQFLCCKDKK